MMSALVLVEPHQINDASACVRDVAKTLAALVSLVIADLVADAYVVAPPGVDFSLIEARAGCLAISDPSLATALAAAIAQARRSHLLLLQPGFAPAPGFSDEIVSALEASVDEPRLLRHDPQSFAQRLVPNLAPIGGLVAPKSKLPSPLSERQMTIARLARATHAQGLRTTMIPL